MDELLNELQALLDKYKDGTPEGTDTETEEKDMERMAYLTDEIAKRTAANDAAAQARAARVAEARKAIELGEAKRIDSVPLARAASGAGSVRDVTDYAEAEKRGYLKSLATELGVRLTDGNALTDAERAAMKHAAEQRAEFIVTTTNTDAIVPVVLQEKIISLIDGSTALFGDVSRDSEKNQFTLIRHKSIKKGDAAKTAEGAAPADDEENEFDTITMTGEEIKKRVKMTRKMSIQSITGFESWVVREVGGRLAVAGNQFVIDRMGDATLGIATANKIACATAGTLTEADVRKAIGLTKTYDNPAPKGIHIYANTSTIWNQIMGVKDGDGHSYFIPSELTSDPTVEGKAFGKVIKREDALADGVILIGYPDLFKSNLFDGPLTRVVELTDGSWNKATDGYMLYDGGLAVPEAFTQLTIGTASK